MYSVYQNHLVEIINHNALPQTLSAKKKEKKIKTMDNPMHTCIYKNKKQLL